MRQIILDTETTGLSPKSGHRVIEIGCVEMVNRQLTGNTLHYYFNPEREVDPGAMRVHGITNEFLADKPVFQDLAQEIWDFLAGSDLIIHNAPFDLGFLNHEFRLLKNPMLTALEKQCGIIDTLVMARESFKGARNSLDALCKRFKINNAHRTLHGALLDSEILADVYLAMTGGQMDIVLTDHHTVEGESSSVANYTPINVPVKVVKASSEAEKMHEAYLQSLVQSSGQALWQKAEAQRET